MGPGKASCNGEGPGRKRLDHHYHYFGVNVGVKAHAFCLTLSVECVAEFGVRWMPLGEVHGPPASPTPEGSPGLCW